VEQKFIVFDGENYVTEKDYSYLVSCTEEEARKNPITLEEAQEWVDFLGVNAKAVPING